MSPSTNTQYKYTENITISTESTTITVSPSTFVTKALLDTRIQSMIDLLKEKFDEQHQ